jgi:hypothetical protein
MKKLILTEGQVKYIIDNLMEQGDIGDPRYRDRKAEKETRRAQKNYKEGPLDWGGGFNGGFNFLSQQAGAVNVGSSLYKISYHTMANNQGKAMPGKQTPPKETPPQKQEPTLSTFTVQGSSLPYADNMVKPYFDKYPDALATFNGILTKFVDYIKNGGGPNLTNVTIKGSADSAAPTTVVPAGYSKLDHPSGRPYNGLTDPMERNQYLADTRASEYAKVLSYKVKELTGFDLNIKVLPGDNYYGQAGKRGDQFRNIVLTPNAGELKQTQPAQPETQATSTPATSEPGQNVKIASVPYKVPVYEDGEGYLVNGYNVTDGRGNNFYGISNKNASDMQLPQLFTGTMECAIDNKKGNFYVGNEIVGEIQQGDGGGQFETYGKEVQYFVGPITTIRETRDNEIDGQGMVSVSYLANVYFLFYK